METIELKEQKNNIAINYQNYSVINQNEFDLSEIKTMPFEEYKKMSLKDKARYLDNTRGVGTELTIEEIVQIIKESRNEQ